MPIIPSEHALKRMRQRGVTLEEIEETVELGIQRKEADGDDVFRKSFDFCREHNGTYYRLKHIEVYAVFEHPNWIIKTVYVKYSS
jgi:hypothetical protein